MSSFLCKALQHVKTLDGLMCFCGNVLCTCKSYHGVVSFCKSRFLSRLFSVMGHSKIKFHSLVMFCKEEGELAYMNFFLSFLSHGKHPSVSINSTCISSAYRHRKIFIFLPLHHLCDSAFAKSPFLGSFVWHISPSLGN